MGARWDQKKGPCYEGLDARDGIGGGGSRNSGNDKAFVYNSSSSLELELGASSNGFVGNNRFPFVGGGVGNRPSGRSKNQESGSKSQKMSQANHLHSPTTPSHHCLEEVLGNGPE